MRKVLLITGGALVIYMMFAGFATQMAGLHGTKLWSLRAALLLLGLMAAGVAIWFFFHKEKKEKAATASLEAGESGDDIDLLIREAETKLASARTAKGARIGNLPAIFLIGDTGTAKTST